jgi:predicted membrane protein
MDTHGTIKGRYIAAGIIIGLGVLLLLSNLGFLHFGSLVHTWWPTAVIIWVVWRFFANEDRNTIWLLSVAIVMAIIQAGRLGWLTSDIWAFWPLMLVLLGISILSKKPGRKVSMESPSFQKTSDNTIDAFALFTQVEKVVQSPAFVGGEATSIFGATKVDLSLTTPSTGDMYMKVNAIFGEVVIRVPTDWNVSFNITPVFGGAEDIRSILNSSYQSAAPMLHITGSAVFGAVKLKN